MLTRSKILRLLQGSRNQASEFQFGYLEGNQILGNDPSRNRFPENYGKFSSFGKSRNNFQLKINCVFMKEENGRWDRSFHPIWTKDLPISVDLLNLCLSDGNKWNKSNWSLSWNIVSSRVWEIWQKTNLIALAWMKREFTAKKIKIEGFRVIGIISSVDVILFLRAHVPNSTFFTKKKGGPKKCPN